MRRAIQGLVIGLALASACHIETSALGDRTGPTDAGLDATSPPSDAGPRDAGARPVDGGRPDAREGERDAGPEEVQPDAGRPDAGRPDAGRPDAGRPDAGRPDAGPPDCATLYGSATGFRLCSETPTTCEFFTVFGGQTCATLCGPRCIEQHFDVDDSCTRLSGPHACDLPQGDGLCVCARR